MASFSAKNPHASKPPLTKDALLDLPVGQLAKKRWDHAFGCPISHTAKKQFTLTLGEKNYVLADVRLVRQLCTEQDPQSLPLEFFFDGTTDGLDMDAFNAAFEKKVDERLQERRIAVFRKKLAAKTQARKRGSAPEPADEEGGSGGAHLEDDGWQAYLSTKVDPLKLQVEACREAGCMLIFVAIRASISAGACLSLGEVAFPEHFLVHEEAEEAMAEENKMPMPRWVYGLGGVVAFTFLCSAYAVLEVGKTAHFG